MLAEINEIEDVLLETRSAEADRGFEEFRTDPRIPTDGVRHFVDVRPGRLAEGRNGIDRGNPLGEEGIGHKFGQLGRPQVRGDDPVARNPPGVDADQLLQGRFARGRALAADEDAVGLEQVGDGRAFGEKLRVGEHLEITVARVGTQNGQNGFRRFHRNRALFDNDLRPLGHAGDHAGGAFDETQVRGAPRPDAVGFGRRADADENYFPVADGALDIRFEVQVASACFAHDIVEAGFVDRQVVGIPRRDACLVRVDDGDLDIGTLRGDHRHGGTADVTGA